MEKIIFRRLRKNIRLKFIRAFAESKSIRTKLLLNFILIVLISVSTFDALLIYFVRQHYYSNLEALMTSQIKTSVEFYQRFFSDSSLEENVLYNVDVFWSQTDAQVQIISKDGTVLMDSIGVKHEKPLTSPDITTALNGGKGKWVGNVDYDKDKVMAIAYPLVRDNKTEGVLRFVASLRDVNREVRKISILFLSVGMVIIILVFSLSLFMADSIVNPLKELTHIALKMAKGNYSVRCKKYKEDEINKLSNTLNYMAEEIINRDTIKNEFIASVSHELRTPLTAIKGWAVTLNNDMEDTAILKDGLDIIVKESDRLSTMVEELLDFSRFVTGKIILNMEEVTTEEFIKYIRKFMEVRAAKEGIEYGIIKDELPITFIADVNRFKQVLINVLDNAFKFTPRGGRVELSICKEGDFMTFKVSDTGIGISKEDLPKVKERFFKGKSSKSQTGLGLSISDEIIKLHSGSLIFKSELDRGTDVYIRIPV